MIDYKSTVAFHQGPFHFPDIPDCHSIEAHYLAARRTPGRNITATAALASARLSVARGDTVHPETLRALYYEGGWKRMDTCTGMERHAERPYFCDGLPSGWRDANRVGMRSPPYVSFYTSDDGRFGDSIEGVVAQIPARGGVCQYVPGHVGPNEGWTLYPQDRCDDATECARLADGYAEHAANREIEYNDAWRAGQDCCAKRGESRDAWVAAKSAAHDWASDRAAFESSGLAATTPTVARARASALEFVRRCLADSWDARRAADSLADGWRGGSLEDAFSDGASAG